MSVLLLIAGILLIIFVIYDFTYTTLAPRGAGIITGKISHWIWSSALFFTGKRGSHPFLNNIGYLIIYAILLIWICMIWLGNTLIIYSDPLALQNADKEFVTNFSDKLYYTGYVLSTMGSGDYIPVSSFWEVYAAVISFTGLVFITIAISYIVPVISAVSEKRALSVYISSLGRSPIEILQKAYNGQDFKSMENHLLNLHQEILMLIQNHQAYPVLHYFHSTMQFNESSINICKLDEVITLLIYAIKDDYRPSDSHIMPVRYSLSRFLETLHDAYIDPAKDTPNPPNVEWFEDKPDIHLDKWHHYYGDLEMRRKVLKAYLNNHGWTWEDLYNPDYEKGLFDLDEEFKKVDPDD